MRIRVAMRNNISAKPLKMISVIKRLRKGEDSIAMSQQEHHLRLSDKEAVMTVKNFLEIRLNDEQTENINEIQGFVKSTDIIITCTNFQKS